MPVFFAPPSCFTPPTVSITGALLTHLRDSLRLSVGETILLSDGLRLRYRTEVTAISRQTLEGRIIEIITRPPRRAPTLALGQALLKGDRMDWAIQKATELGVETIIPVQSQRSIVQLKAERVTTQTARWQRIVFDAAQQSEQWEVPTVASPLALSFHDLLRSHHSVTLILVERRTGATSLSTFSLPTSPEGSILVLVGPEGGWAEEEVLEAMKQGCIPVTLGNRILRAETAATVAIGLLQSRLGELG